MDLRITRYVLHKGMYCSRCREKMQVQTHRTHKQEKWHCRRCGAVRMKSARYHRALGKRRKSILSS